MAATPSPLISLIHVSKSFGAVKALDDVSFQVSPGEIFGFLGPNGAGKTTTIRLIMDFLRPDSGTISIFGQDAQRDSVALKNMIGYMPSGERLYSKWTGRQHINFVKRIRKLGNLDQELVKKLQFDPSRKTKHLSTGNRQKLALILAFMSRPQLLILDEPTVGLDPILQNVVYEMLFDIQKHGGTVFLSSHNLSEVQKVCTRVAVIRQGKLRAVEDIASLRGREVHQVDVQFADTVDPKTFSIPGVTVSHVLKDIVTFKVRGDINKFLTAINMYKIKDMEFTHASLEEVFLEMYQNGK